MHLFAITCFVSLVAPLGSFFISGVKRALKLESLGGTLYQGGVIDRLDCILILGLFLFIYVNSVIYKPTSVVQKLKDLIL
jgi:phosphatidate cytidylyltransferase